MKCFEEAIFLFFALPTASIAICRSIRTSSSTFGISGERAASLREKAAFATSRRQDSLNRKLEFWTPQFGTEEKAMLAAVIDSGFLNDGDVTTQFEKEMAQMF